MIKVYKIVTIIFVLIVICAPSCGDEQAANREEAILNDTKTSIRTEFEFDYLTEASLFAFEKTAKQKLSDFADYLQIMTDSSLDISFRVKAGEMIKTTFQSEETNLHLVPNYGEPGQEVNIGTLINKGLENKLSLTTFTFSSIRVLESLHRTGSATYSGILLFSQNYTKPSHPEQMSKSVDREVDFYVMKQDKIFGTDTLNIWNVKLGEIR